MDKQNYTKPTTMLIAIEEEELLAGSPTLRSIGYGGDDGGSGTAEAKGFSGWDDED